MRSRLIFPDDVVLNRLHAPRWDFILGMIVLYFLVYKMFEISVLTLLSDPQVPEAQVALPLADLFLP
jgi:hypothetical protein